MKKVAFLTICLLATLTLASCTFALTTVHPSGKVITEERQVSAFSKVTVSGVGELDITQGDSIALTIEADDNLMPYLTSEVHGETLELGVQDNFNININGTTTIRYHLIVINLDDITLSGMVDVSSGTLTTGSLRIDISGSGSVSITSLTADSLNITLSGMGDLTVAGEVTSQTIEISGTGSFHAADLRSQTASIAFNGMGDATVWVTEALDVQISGSGTLGYYGNPQLTQEISGMGSVNSLGSK